MALSASFVDSLPNRSFSHLAFSFPGFCLSLLFSGTFGDCDYSSNATSTYVVQLAATCRTMWNILQMPVAWTNVILAGRYASRLTPDHALTLACRG